MKKVFSLLLIAFVFNSFAEVINNTIELAGESVSYTSLEGNGTISNSSDVMSIVTVDCASDCTFEGTITGNIRLVKKGAGVLTIATENKGYTGGTYIEEGVLAAKSLSYLGAKGFFCRYVSDRRHQEWCDRPYRLRCRCRFAAMDGSGNPSPRGRYRRS